MRKFVMNVQEMYFMSNVQLTVVKNFNLITTKKKKSITLHKYTNSFWSYSSS